MEVTCKDCGKVFTISQGELEWLNKKGFEPFKRCKECRAKRKAEQNDTFQKHSK